MCKIVNPFGQEIDLLQFKKKYCTFCGTQRCPGIENEFWRTGCKIFNSLGNPDNPDPEPEPIKQTILIGVEVDAKQYDSLMRSLHRGEPIDPSIRLTSVYLQGNSMKTVLEELKKEMDEQWDELIRKNS